MGVAHLGWFINQFVSRLWGAALCAERNVDKREVGSYTRVGTP
jgi:hypothetical protein